MDHQQTFSSLTLTNVSPSVPVPDLAGGRIYPHDLLTPSHLGASTHNYPSKDCSQCHVNTNCAALMRYYQSSFKKNETSESKLHTISTNSSQASSLNALDQSRLSNETSGRGDAPEIVPPETLTTVNIGQKWNQNIATCQPTDQSSYKNALLLPTFQDTTSEGMVPSTTIAKYTAGGLLTADNSAREHTDPEHDALVSPEDKLVVTEYLYFVTQQLKICHFEEKDRKVRGGKRDQLEVGFGGLECRHCACDTISRKFFWTSVERLANSFSEVSTHMQKCKYCPQQIKTALRELKQAHNAQMTLFPRGSQKVFFRRVWRKLHPTNEAKVGTDGMSVTASPRQNSQGQENTYQDSDGQTTNANCSTSPGIPLATALDKQWLSDMDCFVRRSLEVFCASEADATATRNTKGHHIELQRVGLRCVHCSTTTGAKSSATVFPSSIYGLYDSVRDFHRSHLCRCANLPAEQRSELSRLQASTKSLSSISRRYYVVAAENLGMYDTAEGVFMKRDPVPTVEDCSLGSVTSLDDIEWELEPLDCFGGGDSVASGLTTEPSSESCASDIEFWFSPDLDLETGETATTDSSRKRKRMSTSSDMAEISLGKRPMLDTNIEW